MPGKWDRLPPHIMLYAAVACISLLSSEQNSLQLQYKPKTVFEITRCAAVLRGIITIEPPLRNVTAHHREKKCALAFCPLNMKRCQNRTHVGSICFHSKHSGAKIRSRVLRKKAFTITLRASISRDEFSILSASPSKS